MPNITIENDDLRLVLRPALGAGVVAFKARAPSGDWVPIWREGNPEATHFNDLASYTLAPWTNRIAAASFTFEGKPHSLRADWKDGTAIHGIVKDHPHHILDRTPVSARFTFDSRDVPDANCPFPFTCTTRYELRARELITECTVSALDYRMPAGIGFHPYFQRGLWSEHDDVAVFIPAGTGGGLHGRYQCREMLPFGPPVHDELTQHLSAGKPLAMLALDEVFQGGLDGAEIRWPASRVTARFSVSEPLGHTVIYTGRPDSGKMPDSFCLEPVTMANDGFNLLSKGWKNTGVVVLDPGQSLSVSWSLTISTP